MTYEVLADKTGNGTWRAEAIGPEGECYVTIFSGPNAETRAQGFGKLSVVLEALECSEPIAAHYPEPNDRHNNATAYVRMAIGA